MVRRASLLLFLVLSPWLLSRPAMPAARWETLPPTPPAAAGGTSGLAQVDGIALHYVTFGDQHEGPPVVLLHGGLANAEYWSNQVRALVPRHRVILVDSRGHGRSTRDARPFGYDLMADDIVGLLDVLRVPVADLVGWSDGAILAGLVANFWKRAQI